MGFFDSLGKGLKKVNEYAQDKKEEMDRLYERYSEYDDERLKQIFKNSSGIEKIMAGKVLKERGYGSR